MENKATDEIDLAEVKASINTLKILNTTIDILMNSEGDFTKEQRELILSHINGIIEGLEAFVEGVEGGEE